MIVEIIPAIKLPRSLSTFSYTVPKKLEDQVKIGQIININFKGRLVKAIIFKINKNHQTKFKLKEFEKIIAPPTLITSQQINLIFQMSRYYYLSPALIAKSLVPKIPKRLKNYKITKTPACAGRQKHKNPDRDPLWDTKILLELPRDQDSSLWQYNSIPEKINLYTETILKNLNNKKQTLVVVPAIQDLNLLKQALIQQNFKPEYIITITAQQGIKEEFTKWLEILSGRPRIIISTKIGVFYPFNNLGSIIVDQSESWDHKQSDINPRYDTRMVALMLGSLHKCKVYFTSAAHRLEEIRKFGNSEIRTKLQIKNSGINATVIDLKNEYKDKNFALISDKLEAAIKNTLTKGERAFLFLNRKGQGTSTLCRECDYIFECPECHLPLSLHDETRVKCHYCNYWQDLPPFCPTCHGPNLKSFGQGTQRVEKYVKKIFAGVNILRLDKDMNKKANFQFPTRLPDRQVSNFQLIIGTEYALNKINWEQIKLVGILNADTGLNIPDFRAAEKTYQLLKRIIALFTNVETRLIASQGTCQTTTKTRLIASLHRRIIIQTYHPDSHIITAIENNQPQLFYNQELENRQNLNYPPFTRLIKLIYRDQSKKKAAYMADRLYRDLIKFKKKNKIEKIEILEPVKAYIEKVRGRYRYYVILKHKITKSQNHKKQLDDLIKIVPNDWVVDVDPESLL